jgi:hypothetical protein
MKKVLFVSAVLVFGASISFTMSAERAAAQGPAGAGAPAAAQESSHGSHSLNPIKWVKRDSKNSTDAAGNRSEIEKKLTPSLQAQGVLPANVTTSDACSLFTTLETCLSALHASHNLGVDFKCLRAEVSGVHTSSDISGCQVADGEKALDLNKAIHQLKPEANAKQATKDAERQAKDDLKGIGG